MVREFLFQLIDGLDGIMVRHVVSEARNQQFSLDFGVEFFGVLQAFGDGLFPANVFFSVRVALHLHDKFLHFGEVAVCRGKACHESSG